MSRLFLEKWERWIVMGLFVLAVVLATFCLTRNPPSWFDEGIYQQIVSNLARTGAAGLQITPFFSSDLSVISVGYPVFYPAVAAFALFGDGIAILRSVAVAFLLGFLGSTYLLSRRLYGVPSALATLALLVTFSPLYGHGKNFLGEVPGLFYFVSGLLLLTSWEDAPEKRRTPMLLSGVSLGFAAAAKPTYLLILPAVAIGLAWNWRQYVLDGRSRSATVLFLLGILLALLGWFVTQFGGSFSPARIFAHYSNPYYITDFGPIIARNVTRFFTETTPAHFLLFLSTSFFFVGHAIRRRRIPRTAEACLIIFSVLMLAFYLRTAGWYRYFFPAHALLFILFPASLRTLFASAGRFFRSYTPHALRISLFLLGCLHLIPIVQERFSCTVDAPTALEPVLSTLPTDSPILFASIPQVAARARPDEMYQYVRMSDHLALGEENLRLAETGFFSRILLEEGASFRFPSCYETERVVHGVRILQRNLNATCHKPL